MDISYLLWLQKLRDLLGAPSEAFFGFFSEIAATPVTYVVLAAVFWCFNKRAGTLFLFNLSGGSLFNQAVKNTVCAYRPWMRDARIIPSGYAFELATGYSFPSGHSVNAVALFGTAAYCLRRKKLIAVFCIIVAALIMFSRNFLGVHTPQDVIAGATIGVISFFLNIKLLDFADQKKNNDIVILILGIIISAAFILYTALKPYPLDYDASGALMADPERMIDDCFKAFGVFSGLIVGWFIERRFINFSVDVSPVKKLLRFVFGGLAVYSVYLCEGGFISAFGLHFGEALMFFTMFIVLFCLWPFVFSLVEKALDKKARQNSGDKE